MEYIFVYGQFRDSARSLLGIAKYCGKANISGKIYKVNEFYPGWIPGDGKVWGDVYLVDPNLFQILDEFEGDEFTRVKVRTSTDIECWIYQYKYDVSNFKEIIGGDWMLR
jgi:gamma-glutamylcyclotransferase (GGCT)/AIG2-like uncharacterized protein YtfP